MDANITLMAGKNKIEKKKKKDLESTFVEKLISFSLVNFCISASTFIKMLFNTLNRYKSSEKLRLICAVFSVLERASDTCYVS